MNNSNLTLTIIFEPLFYKTIFEKHSNNIYSIATFTLGTFEPRIQKLYQFVLLHWNQLNFFKTNTPDHLVHKKINPKRLQRLVKKQVSNNEILGTKAQQAIHLVHESVKKEHIKQKSINKKNSKQKKFELRQIKKLEKHLGH